MRKVVAFLLFFFVFSFFFALDKTGSSNHTLFWISFWSQFEKNAFYVFDVDHQATYENKTLPTRIIKRIVNDLGDNVVINSNGIAINGNYLKLSKPLSGMQPATYKGNNCYVAFLAHEKSYDSRYFGCVRIENARKIIPLL